jgi:hypothetical protein
VTDRAGRTLEELAQRIRFSPMFLLPVLEDERDRGHVVCVGDRWRTTEHFDLTYGAAFRALESEGRQA